MVSLSDQGTFFLSSTALTADSGGTQKDSEHEKNRKTKAGHAGGASTHVLRKQGGKVLLRLSREFLCLLHRDKVLHQNGPQFVVKLAVNLLQFFQAGRKDKAK